MDVAMSSDPALKQAVEDYPIAKMISESLIEDEVRGVLGENDVVVKSINTARKKDGSKWGPWIIAATFIGAMIVSVYQWNRYSEIETRWTQFVENEYTFPKSNIKRSLDIEALQPLDRATYLFELRRFEESKAILLSIESQNDTIDWYLANIYFLEKEFHKSLYHLDKNDQSENSKNLKKEIYRIINY